MCPPPTPVAQRVAGSARSRRAGWIRRRRTARPTRPDRADRLGDRGRVIAALVDLDLLVVAGGPFLHRVLRGGGRRLEQLAQLVDVAVERLFSGGDVAAGDQLQGLVGPCLLREDARLRELFEPLRCPRFGCARSRSPPTGWPRRPTRSPATTMAAATTSPMLNCRFVRRYMITEPTPIATRASTSSARPTIGSDPTARWSSSTVARLAV